MSFNKNPVTGQLSLSLMFLSDFTACWVVNLAVLETIVDAPDWPKGFVVNSYLSVFAVLKDREEDVRVKHLLQGTFGDTQALNFFDSIANHLCFGGCYFDIMKQMDDYRDKMPVWTLVHARHPTQVHWIQLLPMYP